MAVTEAHKKASKKWNSSRDNIMIRPTKEEGARIRAAAANSSEKSVQGYVLNAVRIRMESEGGETSEYAGKLQIDRSSGKRRMDRAGNRESD